MRLSDLREGDAGRFTEQPKNYPNLDCKRFVIYSRFPEDRSSGGTTIYVENSKRYKFLWDYDDPEVEKIGTGEVVTTVIFHPTN